ncbi:MAG: ABC transporter ATP-binding protein [Acidobacteriaceae bacterium]
MADDEESGEGQGRSDHSSGASATPSGAGEAAPKGEETTGLEALEELRALGKPGDGTTAGGDAEDDDEEESSSVFDAALIAGPPEIPRPYIAFDKVSKSFGDLEVLKSISFFVYPGETLCILGRSGVGKSVSLQMLMGFLKPDSGCITVAGDDITGYTEKQMQQLRRKVTMVFQNGALFDSISVGENVAFALRERGDLYEDQIQQVVKGMLEMVGVAGMEDLLPSDLSTGMKRSVAIARALASQPEAILYDEPTTMVDPLMAHLLGDLIQRLKHQLHLTSIVVTHDMRLAKKVADRVVFLHEGEALFFGTMDEMERSDDPVLRQFLDLDALVLPGGATTPTTPPRPTAAA